MLGLFKSHLYKFRKVTIFWWLLLIPSVLDFIFLFMKIDEPKEGILADFKLSLANDMHFFVSQSSFIIFSFITPFLFTLQIIAFVYIEKQSNTTYYFLDSKKDLIKYFVSICLAMLIFIGVTLIIKLLFHLVYLEIFSLIRPDLDIHLTLSSIINEMEAFIVVDFSSFSVIPIVLLISFLSNSYLTISFLLSIFGIAIPFNYQPYHLSWTGLGTLLDPRQVKSSLAGIESLMFNPVFPLAFSLIYSIAIFILIVPFFKRISIRYH